MVDAIDSKSILGCQGAGSSPVIGKLILFDFDGLLVDTEKLHHQAYEEALLSFDTPLNLDFSFYINLAHAASGTGLKDYIYKAFPDLDGMWIDIRKKKIEIYSNLIETKLDLMPYVEEFIRLITVKKIPSCVVTNSLKKDVDRIRNKIDALNMIPHWLTREDYENPKPAPDGYLKALSLFPHIKSSDCSGFEDTLKGVKALQGAKVRPYLICNPNHPQLEDVKNITHYPSFEPFVKVAFEL
jgi:beta-phosphoglucomutase